MLYTLVKVNTLCNNYEIFVFTDAVIPFRFRLSMWLVMPRTVWCLTITLNAWLYWTLSLGTGTVTWRDSWQERVRVKHHILYICLLYNITARLPASGVWILVRPCEQLVEEKTELCQYPFHVLWGPAQGTLCCLTVMLSVCVSLLISFLFTFFNKIDEFAILLLFILFLQNTRREIEKLSSFLGLSPSPEEMERIIDLVQFDKMKTNDKVNQSGFAGMDFKVSLFIRKGTVKSNSMKLNLIFVFSLKLKLLIIVMFVQGRLVTGGNISLWPRMTSLRKIMRRKWRIPLWNFP